MTDTARRAAAADSLLRNEMLKQAFIELKAQYIKSWVSCETIEGREDLHRAVNLVDEMQRHLMSLVAQGKVERKRIDRLQVTENG